MAIITSTIKTIAKHTKKRLRDKYDLILAITGFRGKGKSTLARELAKEIYPNFDIEKCTLFAPSSKVVKEKMRKLPKYSCFILDEAIRCLNRREWWKNTAINTTFTIGRDEYKAVIACVPEIGWLDRNFLSMVTLWIHIVDRGVAIVFSKNPIPAAKDPWHTEELYNFIARKLSKKHFFEMTLNDIIMAASKHPSFMYCLKFSKSSSEEEALYDRLKREKKYIKEEEKLSARTRWRLNIIAQLCHWLKELGFRQRVIAKRLGIHEQRISQWIEKFPITPPLESININTDTKNDKILTREGETKKNLTLLKKGQVAGLKEGENDL